jgi:hypothetical protein
VGGLKPLFRKGNAIRAEVSWIWSVGTRYFLRVVMSRERSRVCRGIPLMRGDGMVCLLYDNFVSMSYVQNLNAASRTTFVPHLLYFCRLSEMLLPVVQLGTGFRSMAYNLPRLS